MKHVVLIRLEAIPMDSIAVNRSSARLVQRLAATLLRDISSIPLVNSQQSKEKTI